MDYYALGQRIREIRRQKNMTQAQLAERIGISTSFVGHIERGSRIISLETFARLCAALEAEPNDLLYAAESTGNPAGQLTAKQRQQVRMLLQYACQMIEKDSSPLSC